MENSEMQFLYGDRELLLKKTDLFTAPVEVIVNAANGGLSHGGGIAGHLITLGGDIIQQESDQFIKQHGPLESGMVGLTSAGSLPYQAVLHAVGPRMGEGDEQRKLSYAVANCLKLCSMHDWESIAFPAISSGIFAVPIDIVAEGFYRAITSFWDARLDGAPNKIIICLTENNFQPFFTAFREASQLPIDESAANTLVSTDRGQEDAVAEAGIVNIDETEITALEDDEVNDWFK